MKTRKSFNIKYDIGDLSVLDGYYATGSHSNIIKCVLDGVVDGKQKAHIAYGPYGSGKSYISTILVNILNKTFLERELEVLSQKFSTVDTEISLRFENAEKISNRFLPVILNGYEGDFEKALLKATLRTLKQNNISIYPKGKLASVVNTIRNWAESFPETYRKFISFLDLNMLNEELFLTQFEEDGLLLNKFEEFYKVVSSGASLQFDEETGLIDFLEVALKELESRKLGIFIVYDEFGRLLQNVKHTEVNRFMEQLQSIAELANTGSTNLCVLLIAHKPISHYFLYFDRESRSEFSKIEKRFSISEIRSDNNTFVLITKEVVKKLRKDVISDNLVIDQSRSLNKYRIFSSSLNDTEIENNIIRECFPLHPVTLFSLPRISSVFGQNERTLFTFLHDESSFGLRGYIQNYSGYYFPDLLVDYFFSTINNADLENMKEVRVFRKSLSLVGGYFDEELIETAKRILKFCFLWSITNSNGYVNLNQNFIAYSLGLDQNVVEKIMIVLFERKVLRINATKKFVELIEASAVDLEIEVAKRISYLELNRKVINETLNQYNPNKYIYPTSFNNRFDITRFSEVELNIFGYDFVDVEKNNHDMLIRIVLGNEEILTTRSTNHSHLVGALKIDVTKIVNVLRRIAALQNLNQDRHFLAEYRNVELEISHEMEISIRKLEDFYTKIFNKDILLTCEGTEYKSKSMFDLVNVVEQHIQNLYPDTIIIHNDLINMFLISSIQEKSIIKVIDLRIKNSDVTLDDFFDGNKPEYLVYYSIFNSEYSALREVIRNYIKKNENGSLSKLFKIITSSPYGVRPNLAALFFAFSTFDMWKNIMFFSKENFISDLPAQNLFMAGRGEVDFQYSYSNFEFENRELIEKIVSEFGPVSDGVANKSLTIKACSCLYNWYLSLPVIVQLGNNIGLQERYFTRAIEKAKTNPKESIELIVELIGGDWEYLLEIKRNIEMSFELFVSSLDDKIRKNLKIETWKDWAYSQNDAIARANDFVKLCMTSDNVLLDFSKSIEELSIERWPLAMFDVLKANIEDIVARLNNELETIEISINGKIKHIIDVELSNKAKLMQTNLSNMIEANRKYITGAEIEKVVLEIVEKFLK